MKPGDKVRVIDTAAERYGEQGVLVVVDRHEMYWVRFADGRSPDRFTQQQLQVVGDQAS